MGGYTYYLVECLEDDEESTSLACFGRGADEGGLALCNKSTEGNCVIENEVLPGL